MERKSLNEYNTYLKNVIKINGAEILLLNEEFVKKNQVLDATIEEKTL